MDYAVSMLWTVDWVVDCVVDCLVDYDIDCAGQSTCLQVL